MARISDLSPEILRKIARCLRSYDSAKERAEILDTVDIRDVRQNMRLEQASLMNLSATCRAFNLLLKPEAYYFISTVTMEYSNRPFQSIALLELLENRPDICSRVEQAHLVLSPEKSPIDMLPSVRSRLFKSMFRRITSKCGAQLEQSIRRIASGPESFSFEECIFAITLAQLLPYLRNIRGLSLFTTSKILFRTACYLSQYPGLTNSGHSKCNEASDGLQRDTILPNLTSLAVNHPDGAFHDDYMTEIEDWEPMAVLKVPTQISDIWVSGLGAPIPLGLTPESLCRSITSINLRNTCISNEALQNMVGRIRQLTVFKYFIDESRSYEHVDEPLTAPEILSSLEVHVKSLRTFCYRNQDAYGRYDVEEYESFEAFRPFNFEHLWVDIGGCAGEPPELADNVLGNLPKSLKRLHISGDVDWIVDNLQWLASNCKPDVMPQLEEVAFENCPQNEEYRTEQAGIRSIFKEFRRVGVRVSHEVDEHPFLW